MEKQRQEVRLSFAPDISNEPLVCRLVQDYKLEFNILEARISPRKEGHLVLELLGTQDSIKKGIAYLKEYGVRVLGVSHDTARQEELCMHCGMCTAVCSVRALHVDVDTRLVRFERDKCTSCGLCTKVCPVFAMRRDVQQMIL